MITFRKYVPGFAINGPVEQEIIKYETQKDMLKDLHRDGIYRFSIEKDQFGKLILMAEYDKGKTWYVLGFILDYGKNQIDLPKWKPKN